jgi:hypothetical protein
MLVCLCALAAPVAAQVTSADFEPELKGWDLGSTVNTPRLVAAITKALAHYNWRVVESKPGYALAVYTKDGGAVSAKIAVIYTASGYIVRYIDSVGLNADLANKRIHRNYVRWVNNLSKAIYTYYFGA